MSVFAHLYLQGPLWNGAVCPKFQNVFYFLDVFELRKIRWNCNSFTKYKITFQKVTKYKVQEMYFKYVIHLFVFQLLYNTE